MNIPKIYKKSLLVGVAVVLAMSCNVLFPNAKEDQVWLPEKPTQIVGEVQNVYEIGIHIDEDGNVHPEGAKYFAEVKLRYVIRFWDVGRLGGKGAAAIYRVYTPVKIVGVEHEENYTSEQLAEIYARRDFPVTEIKLDDLLFTGGPDGEFYGTNSETGKDIYGYLQWNDEAREMHVIFTEDIQQDYLVVSEEPFYNWP